MTEILLSQEVRRPGAAFAETIEVESPEWADVENAVSAMDGRSQTMVVLSRDDWSSLSIGGGGGQFNVVLTTADEQFWSLRGVGTGRADPVGVVVGGQLGYYPDRRVVDMDRVLAAAREFITDGCAATSLEWDRE